MNENWMALYLSIVRGYSCEAALKAILGKVPKKEPQKEVSKKEIKSKSLDLIVKLAIQDKAFSGNTYKECTKKAIKEACLRLNIKEKDLKEILK